MMCLRKTAASSVLIAKQQHFYCMDTILMVSTGGKHSIA